MKIYTTTFTAGTALIIFLLLISFQDLRRKYTTKDRAKDTKSNYHTIAIASAVGGGALLLILLAVVATMCFRRSRRKKGSGKDLQMGSITRNSEAFEEIEAHGTNISGHNNPSFSLTAARNSFEKLRVTLFPRDGLMFLDELGEGAFGKVSFKEGALHSCQSFHWPLCTRNCLLMRKICERYRSFDMSSGEKFEVVFPIKIASTKEKHVMIWNCLITFRYAFHRNTSLPF